jgi:branched-chain amino acid transport system substrate-binding protein
MKKVLTIGALVLLLGLVLGATRGAEAEAQNATPIIIGHSAGVTGFMRPYDWVPHMAAQIAVADINRQGGVLGRKLKLIVADAKSDKVQAGTAAARLLDQGAKVILAPCDFDLGAAAAIEAQKRNVVAISPCAGSVNFGLKGIGPLAFTLGNNNAGYSTQMAEWAHDIRKWKNAYVLQDDENEYSKQGCRAFIARWKHFKDAKMLGVDHFVGTDPSIDAQITRLRQQRPAPDFIFTCSGATSNVLALRSLMAAGLSPKIPLLGAGQQWDGEYWKKSVPGASNIYWPSIGLTNGKDPRPVMNRLVKTLRPKLGDLTSPWVAYGYSAVQTIAIAIRKAGTTDGPKLQKALESFRAVPLVVGPTTFTNKLHMTIDRPGAILKVQKGKTSFVRFYKPKQIPPEREWIGG